MALKIQFTELECEEICNKECKRLEADAGKECPSCGNKMTVGEDEASGVCYACYFKLIDGDNHG